MAELPRLTLAFLQHHAGSAARTIEILAPEDAAALLEHVPVRISAAVFAAMTSVAAARCVVHLPPAVSAALCEALSWTDASAMLRYLDADTRNAVLERLPTGMARRFRRSLEYAEDQVGGWVEMDAPAIVADRTVGEAIKLLAESAESPASHLLLTDEVEKYTGAVSLAALLRASRTATLDSIAQGDCRAVRDSASVLAVAADKEWDTTTLLPVVNHRGELLGGLTRRTLHKALSAQRRPARVVPRDSVLAHLLDAYLVAGEGLLGMLLQIADGGNGKRAARG